MLDRIKSKLNVKLFSAVFCILLFLPAALFAAQQGAAAEKPIKVLVIDGFSNHDWQATTNFIRQTLQDTGLFKVDVSTCPDTPDSNDWQSWLPQFSNYDCIIQNTNNIKNKALRWPRPAELALEKYVKSGGGLYIFHSANNAFDHWKEYDKMIALGWRSKDQGTAIEISQDGKIIAIPPGQGKDTYHGPRTDVVINILNRHPINADFPKSWKTPDLEVYKYPRGPAENLTVLSYAYDPITKKNWPIDWIVTYGKGRVYNSTFGHLFKNQNDPPAMRCIGFQTTFIRAVQWLSTQKITYPLPQNFPTADKISLRLKMQQSKPDLSADDPNQTTQIQLSSPNGKNQILISHDGNDIKYSVTVAGSKLILPSSLGLQFEDFPDANSWQITEHKIPSINQTWIPVFGKRSKISNIYNQLELTLKPTNPQSIPLKLIFRAYEDGIAFRYQIDSDKNTKQLTVTKELTAFNFAEDLSWWSYVPERPPLGPTPISQIDGTVNYPLLCESPGKSIALLEANLKDYPWAIFKSEKDKKDFTISLKKPVTISLPFQSPWRVIMMAKSTGQLLDSDLIVNLNPKADPNDFAWLKPGFSFWDWRVTGYVAPDGFAYGMNLPTWKRSIDFASQTGISYLLLDANWYGPEFAKDSDPFSGGYAADVKKALDYGKTKNVRLILYLNHVAAKKYGIEKILKAYSDWGAAGIKYGFMKISSPLEKVKWTHKVAKLCAENHLLVNFHDGPVPPTGEEAYLPNFFNREFCHAQSDAKRVFGPGDFIKMIHVNMLAGPLDMNNGMFDLNGDYPPRSERMPAQLDSTILAEAARTLITYGGAVTILPDAADSYKQHPDLFSFISRQKYPWTQSKTLDSKMPEYISMMRQSGDIYFVASATNESPRDLSIDLSFLPAGKTFKATIFSDTKTSHYQKDRMSYDVTDKNVTSKDYINAHLAPGSGHCMIIEPL